LVKTAMRSTRVVMLDVLAEEMFEAAGFHIRTVSQFAAYGADRTFRVGVRDRRVDDVIG